MPEPERITPSEVPDGDPAASSRVLALVVLLAWALNLYFYSGYYMSDDGSYLGGIQAIAARAPIDPGNIAHTRLMIVLPAALVYAVSSSVLLTTLLFTLYHPLLVLVVHWIGKLVFAPRAALLAALLVAVSPVYYYYGGAILPDNSLSLWLGLLLAALLWVLREARGASLSERRELALWLAVGGLNGIAYSAKEPGLVLAVPVGLAILIGRLQHGARWRAVRGVFAFAAGLFAFLLLETLVLRALSGGWHFRLTAGVGNEQNVTALLDRVQRQGRWPGERLAFWYSRNAEYFGIGLWVILAAQPIGLWLSRGRLRPGGWVAVTILVSFWLWPFLYLTLGTTSLRQYLPPPLQHARYFSICFAPALLITAAVLVKLCERAAQHLPERVPRRWLRAVPVGLAAAWGVAFFPHFEPGSGAVYRASETKGALAAFQDGRRLHPNLPVVFSSYLGARLAPLLASRDCPECSQVITDVDTLAQAPPRPFVALMLAQARRDSLGPALTRLQKSHTIQLQPIGLGVYRAPLGRRSELRAALYPLLGEFSEPDGPHVEVSQAIALFLVSDVAPR